MIENFSASSASKHINCHGSANLKLAIPHFEYPVRDPDAGRKGEGTRIHEILAQAAGLKRKDMRKVAEALEYVADIRDRRVFKTLIEETVVTDWLPVPGKTTVDLVLYVQDEIHIIDWKTGSIQVEAEENEQLLFYGISYGHLAPKAKGINFHIVQPWAAGGSSHWYADTARLAQFKAEAVAAQEAIQAGSVMLQPGDHCTFCPANPHSRGDKGRPLCPAMMSLLYPQAPIDEDEILGME